MSLTTDFLLDIATEKNDYKVGDPWRFSEFSLVAVIPIVRAVEVPRAYRLLSEVQDKVKIKDSGSIDAMEFVNGSDFPVLVKAGEIVTGATQERAITMSQFIMAGEKVVVPCACVHASKGIRAGQHVKSDGYVPASVRREIYQPWDRGTITVDEGNDWGGSSYLNSPRHINQSRIWGSVNSMSRGLASSSHSYHCAMAASGDARELGDLTSYTHWSSASDDLAGRLNESQKKFDGVIKKVPTTENQVGICLVNLDGFDSLDVFNHPHSWDAIRKNVLKAEAGALADAHKDNPFQYDPEKARSIVQQMLSANWQENVILSKENTNTLAIESETLTGEVVTLYGQPIHASLLRKQS